MILVGGKIKNHILDNLVIDRFPAYVQMKDERVENFYATVDLLDFKNNIYVFNNPNWGNIHPIGWNVIFKKPALLGDVAEAIYSNKFEFHPSYISQVDQINIWFKQTLDRLKQMYLNFDVKVIQKKFGVLFCLNFEGPFMVADGNHRVIIYYIKTIIEKEFSSNKMDKVVLTKSTQPFGWFQRISSLLIQPK